MTRSSRRPRLRPVLAVLAVLTTLALVLPATVSATAAATDTRSVAPFAGSGGRAPWFSGNTSPAAARPFGMVQLGPDTTSDPVGTPSDHASGYAAGDSLLRGFSATHLSGAGCPIFGDVPVLPTSGGLPASPGQATASLDRTTETAGPGWYRARLDTGVTTSLAAGLRTGLLTFTYPRRVAPRVLVKASGSLAGNTRAKLRFRGRSDVEVTSWSRGFCGAPRGYRVHVLLRFDRPIRTRGTWDASARGRHWAAGPAVGGWVRFRPTRTLRVQVGVSFTDAAGARRNLAAERPGWSFTRLRAAAAAEWARELGRLTVTGGTAEQHTLFDTALYRALLHPTTVSDADGRYPGFDGRIRTVPRGQRQFSAVAGWDAYRTHVPLLAWLRPDVAAQVVQSLQRAARESGWLPRWPVVATDTGVMNGDSAAPVVVAAWAFGARAFPLGPVVDALVRQADDPTLSGPGGLQPRPALADYLRLGYVPNTAPEGGWPQPHGGSTTLEYAVDDFAVSRLARAAGRTGVADRFRRRSGSWANLFDPVRRLVLPRDGDGAFPGPQYDPASCCHGFQEGNALQYTWGVPQDMAGLVDRIGRPTALARLDDFHRLLYAGAGRPHAWLGNQPSFATPWAYLWLGEPTRTQDVVARALGERWASTPDGLPGNEDLGSLSAWYLWASLGLYPLTPGTPDVGISTPTFATAVVRSSDGSVTRIVREGDGPHIAGVARDGVPHPRTWLSLAPGDRPREVVVTTTTAADPAWGTDPAAAPPSYPAG